MKEEDLREIDKKKTGVKSILQDGLLKVLQGETSFEEVLRVVDIETDFGDRESELKAALLGKYQEMNE